MKEKTPWYNQIEEWILAVCFGSMTAIVGINIITRYFFGYTMVWSDQAARILFVWCTMIGVSLAALKGSHLKVEILNTVLPRKASICVNLLADVISLVYAVVVGYYMWTYILNIVKFPQYFAVIPWLPATVMYIPGILAMVGFSIRLIQGSTIPQIKEAKALFSNETPQEADET